jgi:O-antigen ligase
MIVGVIAVVAILFGAISGQNPNVFSGDVERMMFGFMAAICFSHIAHGYVGGAINSMDKFLPSITGFFLVLTSLRDRKRLQLFILFLVILTSFVAYEGIRQFTTGFAHGGLEPLLQNIMTSDDEPGKLVRIRWYGVFNDPNDLGLLLVLVIPFLIDMLFGRKFILPLASLPLISLALYYTNSRGSILAALVSIVSYFVFRYRSTKGVIIGIFFALLLFVAGPSRMGGISASEDSAHGRVEAWYAAYQMLKSSPLFGVGQGMFTDYNELTAHNSFILVMAELGIVGLFFFTGLLYYTYNWLWNTLFKRKLAFSEDDNGFISAVYACLTGVLASIFFISRSYVLIPYLAIALAISVSRSISIKYSDYFSNHVATDNNIRSIALITLGQVVVLNIIVKVLL